MLCVAEAAASEYAVELEAVGYMPKFFARQVPIVSYHIIGTVRDFSHNIFLNRECKQENNSDHAFRIRKNSDEEKEETNTSMKIEGIIKKYEQTVSADLEEEQIVVTPS